MPPASPPKAYGFFMPAKGRRGWKVEPAHISLTMSSPSNKGLQSSPCPHVWKSEDPGGRSDVCRPTEVPWPSGPFSAVLLPAPLPMDFSKERLSESLSWILSRQCVVHWF